MQIKIEKFLAFTAMLASAQLMNACVSEDSSSDKGKEDSGLSTGTGKDEVDASEEGGPTEESGPTSEEPTEAEAGGPTDEVGPTDEADASTEGSATGDAGDAGIEGAGDASIGDGGWSADSGATDGGPADEWAPDGSIEGDPTSESDPTSEEAGAGDLCGPDSADEVVYTQCAWDACAEDAPGGEVSQTSCYNAFGNFRPLVADAFWDCYSSDAASEDPCTAEADALASGCYDAAIENACIADNSDCESLAQACPEIGVSECNNAVSPYNAEYLATVNTCVVAAFGAAAPDMGTEGCGSLIYICIDDPYAFSAE